MKYVYGKYGRPPAPSSGRIVPLEFSALWNEFLLNPFKTLVVMIAVFSTASFAAATMALGLSFNSDPVPRGTAFSPSEEQALHSAHIAYLHGIRDGMELAGREVPQDVLAAIDQLQIGSVMKFFGLRNLEMEKMRIAGINDGMSRHMETEQVTGYINFISEMPDDLSDVRARADLVLYGDGRTSRTIDIGSSLGLAKGYEALAEHEIRDVIELVALHVKGSSSGVELKDALGRLSSNTATASTYSDFDLPRTYEFNQMLRAGVDRSVSIVVAPVAP